MNTLQTDLRFWALKHLPLLPELRRIEQAKHLEKCLKMRHTWTPSS